MWPTALNKFDTPCLTGISCCFLVSGVGVFEVKSLSKVYSDMEKPKHGVWKVFVNKLL